MRKINKGYIYKITNLVNQKCYIGQTMKSIEERWKVHKRVSKKKSDRGYNYPLYKAMRKYGIENFTIEQIEECNEKDLDEREIYWIKQYDSTSHMGYNQTLGGSGTKSLDIDEQEVINTYKKIKTVKGVAKEFNCSSHAISRILSKHNISITSSTTLAKEKGYDTVQYDSSHNELRCFTTTRDAARWIENEKLSDLSNTAISLNIKNAILGDYSIYGFYWDSLSYKEEKEKIRKQKEEKEEARKKERERRRLEKEKQKLANRTQILKKGQRKRTYKKGENRCPVCNKLIQNGSNMCTDCYNEKRRAEFLKRNEENGITRDLLKYKIRTQSFLSTGKEFGVSDKAITKWCKIYDLPSKSSEIKKYTDEEWENI